MVRWVFMPSISLAITSTSLAFIFSFSATSIEWAHGKISPSEYFFLMMRRIAFSTLLFILPVL